jgi:hypothetical protein
MVAAVNAWTSRPDLTAELDIAIRQAVRAAHNAGKFYRDLASLPITGLATDQLQTVDLSVSAPNYRKLAYVKPTGYDVQYKEVNILDLFDQDNFLRTDVFWVVGNTLNIRAASAVPDITVLYYTNPTTVPIASLNSWIVTLYPDLIACWAAANILAQIGEQEIKTRVEAIAASQRLELIANELSAAG